MNAPQGSEAWALARCGRATSSEFSSILAKGEGKMRAAYLIRVVAERLTGKPVDTYHNGHMERGQEQETWARMAYQARTGLLVEESEFIPHPKLQTGCSPDGLIGEDGGLELKSVIPTVHVETMLRGAYPPKHRAQIMGNLWLADRQWWDFCSYCPDMPPHLQVYIFRVERDAKYIETLTAEVVRFLEEADELYKRLMGVFHIDPNDPATQA